MVMVSSLPGDVADPFSQARELAEALAANARKVVGTAANGVWSKKARGFFSSVAAGTGFTIVAKNYLRQSWSNDVFTKAKVVASAVALSQTYGFGNDVAQFEPTNSKRDAIPGEIAENLTIIADFKPTPELKELLAKNFHAEELGIKTDTPSVSPPRVSKRDEWCPDYSLHDRVVHGWAPWNTNYDVGCNI